MIRVTCDKCGKDCYRVGYEVRISVINNPVPVCMTDVGDLKITDDNTKIRFTLCQDCYKNMMLPNPYACLRNHGIDFSET